MERLFVSVLARTLADKRLLHINDISKCAEKPALVAAPKLISGLNKWGV